MSSGGGSDAGWLGFLFSQSPQSVQGGVLLRAPISGVTRGAASAPESGVPVLSLVAMFKLLSVLHVPHLQNDKGSSVPPLFHRTWGEQSEEIDTKTILWKVKMVILLSMILGLSVLLSHRISCNLFLIL